MTFAKMGCVLRNCAKSMPFAPQPSGFWHRRMWITCSRSIWGWTILLPLALASVARGDGVEAWGYNFYGQLGNGTAFVNGVGTFSPFMVTGLTTGVTAIATGGVHSLAIQNGALYSWGSNYNGQLGNGTSGFVGVAPMPVIGMSSGVTGISGGASFSLAIQNGAAYAWGYGGDGELGNGGSGTSSVPVAVTGMSSGVTAVAGGYYQSLAIKAGAAYGWGGNYYGELGDGTYGNNSLTPAPIEGLSSGVTAIAAGNQFSLAIQNGAAYAWGNDNVSNVSPGGTYTIPGVIDGLSSGVTGIAAGQDGGLAIKDGAVYTWGYNNFGQLGDGTTAFGSEETPKLVPGLSDIVQVAADDLSDYALAADGSLWVWGDNYVGQLGLGDTDPRLSPTQLFAPPGYVFTSIDGQEYAEHVLATVAPAPEVGSGVALGLGWVAWALRRRRA